MIQIQTDRQPDKEREEKNRDKQEKDTDRQKENVLTLFRSKMEMNRMKYVCIE